MGNGEEEVLHVAARAGDMKAVQSILSTNPLLINSRDKHSRTPLHLAAWSGQTEVVSYLCKQKADVGAAAMDDMGAIHFASQKGHLEIVKTLVSSGVSVKSSNRKGLTPLHYAVQGSHPELVKYLVRKGASTTAKTKAGKTPLNLACNEEICSFLEEWEQYSNKGNVNGKAKADLSDSKHLVVEKPGNLVLKLASNIDEKGDEMLKRDSGVEASASSLDEKEDESIKRKSDIKEASSGTKKAKVALQHLHSIDDTKDDEEAS